MCAHRRIAALTPILLILSAAAGACGGSGSTAGVDRSEGTADLRVDGQSANRVPLTCPGHTRLGPVDTPGGPGGYGVVATLQGTTAARVEVTQSEYKSEPITYMGTAAVHLDSTSGPAGSLSARVQTGSSGTVGGNAVDVALRFHCSANGGGVYTGRADINEHQRVALYFTVNHEGTEVVDLVAAPQGSVDHPLPNVQLRGSDIPIGSDGTFRLTSTLVAADPTGVAAAGKRATLVGSIDRTGSASGTIAYPSQVTDQAVRWSGSVAGPIAVPEFPHAPLDTKLVSAAQVASDPAINLLYPGSTNEDGSAPGAPYARGETPQDRWSHMEFALPSGGNPAQAVRAQQTPGSVYDVAAWYQQQLTALGWQTTTQTDFGNVPSLVFLDGPRRLLVIEFTPPPAGEPATTRYRLTLETAVQTSVTLVDGRRLGPPTPPIQPCIPIQPASISITGTITGTAASTCSMVDAETAPRCAYPTVGFTVGQVRFVVWGPPYTANGMTITGPHLETSGAPPVEPLALSVNNGTLRMHGHFSGGGYDEAVDLSTACTG